VPVPSPLTGWSGWVGAFGVGVAEGAGPGVGAGFGFGEFPAVFFHLVVVWAEGVEFGDCGVVVLGPGEGVVDVTVV
jgi:hypothetical protein